jgi:hypothetical protein
MTSIDHKSLAISRLATQFKESTNLINYIRALLLEANNLEEVFLDLLEKRWIDTAEGVNLDILGSIVGQSREFIDAEIFDYFGFADNPQAQSFGSVSDSSLGGRFKFVDEVITGIRQLSDDEYRLFIKVRISRNRTSSTPEDIIAQIRYIFDSPLVLFVDGDTKYEISVGRKLGLNEKSILLDTNIVPKTAGVQASYVTEFDSNNFFGFQGLPNSLGLGSVSNPSQGGKLGNLIF